MSKKAILSLAAGFGSGYLGAQRQGELDAERKADRADAAEERQLRLTSLRQQNEQRIALADAARPVAVETPNDVLMDDDGNAMPAVDPYRVGANRYADINLAQTAANAQNTPEARRTRQVAVLDAQGKPGEAIALENAVTAQKEHAAKFSSEQAAAAKKLKDENAFDTARAMRTGDPLAIMDAFNKGGEWKIDGTPTVTPVEREIPGIGKIKTYDVSANLRGPDGKAVQRNVNSHDVSMQLLPYEKAMELQRKAGDSDEKRQYHQGLLDAKIKQLELTGEIAQAKALARAAAAGASNGNSKVAEADRKRFTELSREATRDVDTAEKTLNTLRKDLLFMNKASKPGTPEADDLAEVRAKIKRSTEDRELYRSLLVDPSPERKASLADAKSPSKPAGTGPARPANKAEYDKLPKGTTYVHPDGTTKVKN